MVSIESDDDGAAKKKGGRLSKKFGSFPGSHAQVVLIKISIKFGIIDSK